MGQPKGIEYDEIDKPTPEANASAAASSTPASQPAPPAPVQGPPGAATAEAGKPAA